MKMSKVTPAMVRLMSPENQARYSQGGDLLIAASQPLGNDKFSVKLERDEHKTFVSWLSLNGYPFHHSRTDKRTTDTVGLPDFGVYEKWKEGVERPAITKCLLIEFKVGKNKQSTEQQLWASLCGGKVHIVSTALEAIELVRKEFGT